ncbi:hypothetical protein [Corynebacterium lubricantis]|uniref:hypothetical protein n=1 Tax=Corynebacterium lubricantis TaxID=541095 RepID=UPI0003A93171|nr:hypothetical protein [Corynebacterium lubricantis]
MTIITSVLFLVAGAALAIVATGKFSARDPYGMIPYFIGECLDIEFPWYLTRAVGFFLLIVAAAMAQPVLGLWALLLVVIGAFPSLMMTRAHNRRARKTWWPDSNA